MDTPYTGLFMSFRLQRIANECWLTDLTDTPPWIKIIFNDGYTIDRMHIMQNSWHTGLFRELRLTFSNSSIQNVSNITSVKLGRREDGRTGGREDDPPNFTFGSGNKF